MRRQTLIAGVVLVLVVGVSVVAARWVSSSSGRTFRGTAVERIPQLVAKPDRELAELVVGNYREYRANSVRWSGVYFGCLFGGAALSAIAALLLKLSILDGHEKLQKDLVATLATLSALLVTLSTSGDFGRKWQANRLAASEMENLAYDLLPQGKPVNVADVIQKLQAINTARNLLVAGTDKSIVKPQATPPASGSDRAKPLPSPSPSPSK